MDILEFARAKRRMCASSEDDCSNCPLCSLSTCTFAPSVYESDSTNDGEIVTLVEEWVKNHPEKK